MALFEPDMSGWERPTFKDCVKADIDLAFFNMDEHAEMHIVDGKEMLVVLEEDDMLEHKTHWEWGRKGSMDDGLYRATMTIYLRIEDYGPKPKTGKELVLDAGTDHKRTFRILQCQEESGVYRMTVERARQ